ncbi:MAG TPA: hypothetical protein VJ349_20950, partial [Stellaceae bacterium]|nr:hypothetical protein [Stellaceae bacterium]
DRAIFKEHLLVGPAPRTTADRYPIRLVERSRRRSAGGSGPGRRRATSSGPWDLACWWTGCRIDGMPQDLVLWYTQESREMYYLQRLHLTISLEHAGYG